MFKVTVFLFSQYAISHTALYLEQESVASHRSLDYVAYGMQKYRTSVRWHLIYHSSWKSLKFQSVRLRSFQHEAMQVGPDDEFSMQAGCSPDYEPMLVGKPKPPQSAANQRGGRREEP